MAIIGMQRQQARQGRIRIGTTVTATSRAGKQFQRPEKLDTLRFTSPGRHLIEAVADLLGGEPRPWEKTPGEWEVITESAEVMVTIPPGQDIDPFMEMWARKMCVRRCNREVEQLTGQACLCPEDDAERQQLASKGEACKPTTRVSLMIQDLPGLGTWMIETHGYYGAVELPGVAETIAAAAGQGLMIPARLRIDKRERAIYRGQGQPVDNRSYSVPVIDILASAREIAQAAQEGRMIAGELPPPMVPRKALAAGGQTREIEQQAVKDAAAESMAQDVLNDAQALTTPEDVRAVWREAQQAGLLDEFVKAPHYDELITLADALTDLGKHLSREATA